MPDLSLIVEMADFFDTSVDVLLGYQKKDNSLEKARERILADCKSGDPAALREAEMLLKKYPNRFEVLHGCAQVYTMFGVGHEGRAACRRALELYERSLLLISQNTDPQISLSTVSGEMAMVYTLLGEHETSLDLLKKHNAGGCFDDAIGAILALYLKRPDEAEPYLSAALLKGINILVDAAVSSVLVFCAREDYASARSILRWITDTLQGLKKPDDVGYGKKVGAMLLLLDGYVRLAGGEADGVRDTLVRALDLARQFDSSPDYSLDTLRYANLSGAVQNDSLGVTAAESLDSLVRLLDHPKLSAMWEEVKDRG